MRTETFTGVRVGAEFSLRPGEVLAYAVSGTFVGRVAIEEDAGRGWLELTAATSTTSGTVTNTSPTNARYRIRCTRYTSGTITATAIERSVAASSSPLHQITVVLDNAQIKTLPTIPVEIIPAPGPNRVILCAAVRGDGGAIVWISNWVADYATISTGADGGLKFALGSDGPYAVYAALGGMLEQLLAWGSASALWAIGAGTLSETGSTLNGVSDFANKAVSMSAHNPAGNFTGGDAANTMSVAITYAILDLTTGQFV